MTAPPLPTADDAGPLTLPSRPAPAPRPGVPWLASAVPVVGALGFWAVTGSAFALWFAVLGPVIAVAGFADAARTARRERRAADRAAAQTRARVVARVDARQSVERETRRARHPDVAGYLARPEQIWRPVAARRDQLVVGSGEVPSDVRVSAGDDPDDLGVAGAARVLADAPVLVALRGGVSVVGPAPYARATVRALLLQLACACPPGELEILGAHEEWARALPHTRRGSLRVAWVEGAAVPPGVDAVIVAAQPGQPAATGCAAVLEIVAPGRAVLEVDGVAREVRVEAVGSAQAERVAELLAERSTAQGGDAPGSVALAALRAPERVRSRTGLPVEIGMAASAPFTVDVVRDGPHAVIAGMTGSGKSELLVTWVTALCARYRTDDVAFLLADFKGATSFDALAGLPHVTGVLSDLDDPGAARAIASLRAEIRAREARLAQAGERDIAAIDLPRLIVVVDEFAALRDTHPELESLFWDLAARGRALGIHLILGTQRAGGIFREALLANCPLRISLRVNDPADSTLVVGTGEAASLPGGAEGRGLALIRRSADDRPTSVRVALTDAADVRAAAAGAGMRPQAAWLPPLPVLLPLSALPDAPGMVLGLTDDPQRQRQEPWVFEVAHRGLLAVGGSGSGKTTLLRTAAAQAPNAVRVGPDPEHAWDVLCAAALHPPAAGTILLLDDLDALLARFPEEYSRAAAAAVERLLREAGGHGVALVATVQRLSPATARVAELFPHRLVLGTASRLEHVAAGGEAADFSPHAPPGRGRWGRTLVQVAVSSAAPEDAPMPVTARWQPPQGVAGFVTPRPSGAAAQWWERAGVRVRSIDAAEDPTAVEPGGRVVVVGTATQWISQPRLLERMRTGHPFVVDAACERDLRMLTGERDLPPYADPARGRAWLFTPGAGPTRVAVNPAPEPDI